VEAQNPLADSRNCLQVGKQGFRSSLAQRAGLFFVQFAMEAVTLPRSCTRPFVLSATSGKRTLKGDTVRACMWAPPLAHGSGLTMRYDRSLASSIEGRGGADAASATATRSV
jgi:hypothetical protein